MNESTKHCQMSSKSISPSGAAAAQIVSPRSSSHHRVVTSASDQTTPNNSNPVLQQIKDKALHARNYYESIGLSNGNLPRKSDVRYRLDAPPDDDDVKHTASGSKYGAKWLKKAAPSSTATSPVSLSSSNFAYTYPHKRSGSWTDMKHKTKSPTNEQNDNVFPSATEAQDLQMIKPVQQIIQPSPPTTMNLTATNQSGPKQLTAPKSLSKKSNSCDSIQLFKEKPTKRVYPEDNTPTEIDSFKIANLSGFESNNSVEDISKKDKSMPPQMDTWNDQNVDKSKAMKTSSSYENIVSSRELLSESTAIKINKPKASDQRQKTKYETSRSLPSSTTHVRKKSHHHHHHQHAATFGETTANSSSKSQQHQQKKKPQQLSESTVTSSVVGSFPPVSESNGVNALRCELEKIKDSHEQQPRVDQVDSVAESRTERRLHNFSHYDCQSMTFNFSRVLSAMKGLQRKNVDTGASKAAVGLAAVSSSGGESSRANSHDNLMKIDGGEQERSSSDPAAPCNDLVECCPFFINEIGGERDREIYTSSIGTNASHLSNVTVQMGTHDGKSSRAKARNVLTNHDHLSIVEVPPSDNPLPPQPPAQVSYGVEKVDRGANYYRMFFLDKEHQNYMMNDERYGPIIISLRKEKIEDSNSGGVALHQYRIIIRTSELTTLRGSILEDALTTTRRNLGNHGLGGRSCSPRDVMEHVCKEIDLNELRLAQQNNKMCEELADIDEQMVYSSYKIGVLYCKPGQTTEEEMYNNEHGSPAFDQFLQLLGRKIDLNGFDDFRGGLDVKTGSTGEQSVFTEFNDYKIMFHVSTMLPFTANNPQQLLRKRHIGNDIVTIVFQEPGSEPFSPKSIRSQFQHVFIIVRAVDPCTDNTCYRVGVTRARSVPRFGPAIPEDCMFRKSAAFRQFLLTKVINGENITHHTGKFKSLAMNTRQEYLKDSIRKYRTQQGLDSTDSKFGRFGFAGRRNRDRSNKQNRPQPLTTSCGALVWPVVVTDFNGTAKVHCLLGISNCAITLIEAKRSKLIFSIPCLSVLGWLMPVHRPPNSKELSLYFGRGEKITLHTEGDHRFQIVTRLGKFTKGHEGKSHRWRGPINLEKMGIEINYEGIISNIYQPQLPEQSPFSNVKPSSRMVEISQTSVATLSKDDIKDLLQTTASIYCVLIPPNEDGTPRKCSMELYHLYPVPDVVSLKPDNNNKNNGQQRKSNWPATTPGGPSSLNNTTAPAASAVDRSQRRTSPRRTSSRGDVVMSTYDDLENSGGGHTTSATNTLSSTRSNLTTTSSEDQPQQMMIGSCETVGQNNNNNARMNNNNNASACSNNYNNARMDKARKQIMQGISKHLKPAAPSNNNSKRQQQQQQTRNFLWKAPRNPTTATAAVNNSVSSKNNGINNSKETVKSDKTGRQTSSYYMAVSPPQKLNRPSHHEASRSFDMTPPAPQGRNRGATGTVQTAPSTPTSHMVTSPTVGTYLLKSGNAAKDKRRTTVLEDRALTNNNNKSVFRNFVSVPYDNSRTGRGAATWRKDDASGAKNASRSKVTYRRAVTTNIISPKKDEEAKQQNATQTPNNNLHSDHRRSTTSHHHRHLQRSNSSESILSSSNAALVVDPLSTRGNHESVDKYLKFPMPSSTDSWNEILKAAKQAEKMNGSSASKTRDHPSNQHQLKKKNHNNNHPSVYHSMDDDLNNKSNHHQHHHNNLRYSDALLPSDGEVHHNHHQHVPRPQLLHRHFAKSTDISSNHHHHHHQQQPTGMKSLPHTPQAHHHHHHHRHHHQGRVTVSNGGQVPS